MALVVIGSGFGRTGTKSLKSALEALGFGPCHHMSEVFDNPDQVADWQAHARGEPVDWTRVFAGYRAQVDWPGAAVWRELVTAFPDARVVHSTRPESDWWDSFSATIGPLSATHRERGVPPHVSAMIDAWRGFVGEATFGGRFDDRETAIAAFRRHEAAVVAAIPPERLLVFNVSDGWGPLCAFLGVPEPGTAFPHQNDRAAFMARFGAPA